MKDGVESESHSDDESVSWKGGRGKGEHALLKSKSESE